MNIEEKLNITINAVIEDNELLEIFFNILLNQIETDDEKPESRARQFLKSYLDGDCESALLALFGWTMETLIRWTVLKKLWNEFSGIPIIDTEDCEEVTDADFYHWPKGTDRYDIWHWFDERCPNNLHDDLMFSNY